MGTKQFDNYADLITFTRASGGTALRPISYGSELVTNGTFDTDVSGWASATTLTSTVSWLSGAMQVVTTANFGRAIQAITTEVGKVYRITAELVSTTASPAVLQVSISNTGGSSGAPIGAVTATSPQILEAVFVANSATTYIALGSAENASPRTTVWDNISVKEVLFDQPNAPLTLFNHPTNTPRIEYDADGNRLGLLVEEQRTNLFPYSEEFDNADWTKNDSSIQSNVIISPDGTLTGDKIVENTNTTWHGVSQASASLTSGTTYTATFFVKKAERSIVQILFGVSTHGLSAYANFDILNGTLGTVSGGTASITNIGNNWYRISYLSTAASTATGGAFCAIVPSTTSARVQSYTGDGISGVYIWGAQLEAGAFPTSYIPTSGSTATRAADVASIPTSAFGYNAKQGTVVVEYRQDFYTTSDGSWVFRFHGLGELRSPQTTFGTRWYSSGGGAAAFLGNVVTETVQKVAAAASTTTTDSLSRNGGSIVNSANVSPAAASGGSVDFGYSSNVGSSQLNGHIKSIKYFPRRLSNAQLVELTQ